MGKQRALGALPSICPEISFLGKTVPSQANKALLIFAFWWLLNSAMGTIRKLGS